MTAADAAALDAEDADVPEAGDESCSEKKFFEEHAQVSQLLAELLAAPPDVTEVDAAFERQCATIATILDRYLEQAHLLDPFLRELTEPIMAHVKRAVAATGAACEPPAAANVAFPFQVYRNPRLHKLLQLVYHLCKVRGYKTVVKLLPHEASDFEPTLRLLQSQDRSDHSTWETRYVLLLWLSMLCLVPFDLNTIDSSIPGAGAAAGGAIAIVTDTLTLCKEYLGDPGATQLAASVCLSRLLSRPDMEALYLHRFLAWANSELAAAAHQGADLRAANQFRVTGVMRSLAHIAKNAPREQHAQASRIYFTSVLQLIARMADEDARADRPSSSTLHRKLSVKLVQRLGLLYLPPRVQSWRYQRGLRSLELNMQSIGLLPAGTGEGGVATSSSSSSSPQEHEPDDDVGLEAVEELEQIVEVLLCGLRDKDTVVRWSAAKGVGRITGRLPYEFADDVVQSVLELFVATEGDGAWHGASLALAELARRGVLLPERLPEAADCVARALRYDVRRGTHSIGSHVRDAACYACWSFARAYDAALFLPRLERTLAPAMLINCVFDRELNCRRAASAAFQECVGRQGRANFPHGIELLTRADYFSVSNLRHAYLDVSVFVASFPEYRYCLLEHLLATKLSHWDVQVRTLAAAALGRIATLDPGFAVAQLFPRLLASALAGDVEVIVRHGATLALAELLLALARVPVFLDGEVQKQLKMLPIEVDKRRLFRGRGGELIRAAVCNVVEAIACAALALSFAHVKKYFAVLEECFVHPVESVRTAAINAFAAFTAQYCPKIFEKGSAAHVAFLRALVPRYLNAGVLMTTTERGASTVALNANVAARRGFIRAIGVSADALLQPSVGACLTALMRAASIRRQSADEQDAESRVAAVRALVDICSRARSRLDLAHLEDDVVRTLVQCIREDYGVDERGDVGSWVRKEAIVGLERLLLGESSYDASALQALVGDRVASAYGPGTITRVQAGLRDAADHEPSTSDPICAVQFEKPAFGFYYFPPHGVGLLRLSKLRVSDEENAIDAAFQLPGFADRLEQAQQPLERSSERVGSPQAARQQLPFAKRVSAPLVGEFFCELGKQLAEKLDGVRLVAGRTLFRVLHSTSPRVDAIPDRLALEQTVFPPSLQVNWSMAHDTFPLTVQMMSSPEYLEAVASGLVLSVGGLTESVVKSSKAALFAWVRRHTEQKNVGLLTRFAFFLVALLTHHSQEDRVTLPLMKTLAILLEANVLGFLFATAKHDTADARAGFGAQLYDAVRDEIQRTTSVPKIAAGVAVLTGLLPSEPATERKALKALVLFLGHRFPKVRKVAAEKLYMRLLVHEEVVDEAKYDAVVEILSETAWDASIAHVREARNELLDLLDMERPAKKACVSRIL
ncbi:hypothetical protein PybrP1_000306 [[Pythium] brassicae (nom. inval.)]|nr:hypothetical protein PybrP1_000306 [[Pythium] brassicae (nom. inval.)]